MRPLIFVGNGVEYVCANNCISDIKILSCATIIKSKSVLDILLTVFIKIPITVFVFVLLFNGIAIFLRNIPKLIKQTWSFLVYAYKQIKSSVHNHIKYYCIALLSAAILTIILAILDGLENALILSGSLLFIFLCYSILGLLFRYYEKQNC